MVSGLVITISSADCWLSRSGPQVALTILTISVSHVLWSDYHVTHFLSTLWLTITQMIIHPVGFQMILPKYFWTRKLGSNLLFIFSVRRLLEGVQPTGEPEDPPEVSHRGEALHVRVPRVHQGLQQRVWQSQAPEQDSFQRGKLYLLSPVLVT